jgi:hypothetical protein
MNLYSLLNIKIKSYKKRTIDELKQFLVMTDKHTFINIFENIFSRLYLVDTRLGLVIGFIGLLKFVTVKNYSTIAIHTFYNSL